MYVHWTVVACQPCAFRINHVDNGFRSDAESGSGEQQRNMQKNPKTRGFFWGGGGLFSSVCLVLQSTWRTSQNVIKVKHRNDCRSGTSRLSEGQRWSWLTAAAAGRKLKGLPWIFIYLRDFKKKTKKKLLSPCWSLEVIQIVFYVCFVSVVEVMAFTVITLERNEEKVLTLKIFFWSALLDFWKKNADIIAHFANWIIFFS